MEKRTITEFVQDGTKEVDVEFDALDFDENGVVIGSHKEIKKRQIPNFVERVREMTPEELAAQLELEKTSFYSEIAQSTTLSAKIDMLIESIETLPKPADRPGYVWKQMYDKNSNVFGWEEVVDPFYVPTADGSFINPFQFVDGKAVVSGMFYTDGDNIWEAIRDGFPANFNDREFFDIIG